MIRLILRQIKKHFWALLVLHTLVGVSGWFIYEQRHLLLAHLAHAFTTYPEPGEQFSSRAWFRYARPALRRIEKSGVRTDLMQRACNLQPVRIVGERNLYRSHWLELLSEWNLNPESRWSDSLAHTVEPERYWGENRRTLLASLRDMHHALLLAYEVPGEIWSEAPGAETILLPEIYEEFAMALCRSEMALLMWGDYVAFQEERAWRRLTESSPELVAGQLWPSSEELLLVSALRYDRRYQLALRRYNAGEPPPPWQSGSCSERQPMTLGCAAPRESLRLYHRQLWFADRDERPFLYLRVGTLLATIYYQSRNESYLEQSLDYLHGATTHRATERDALALMIRLYLKSGEGGEAVELLKRLALLSEDRGASDQEFRQLARSALLMVGRTREADCYADLATLPIGRRSHCVDPIF